MIFQIAECLVANLVGDLEPERSVAGCLPIAKFSDGIFYRFTYGIEIAAEGFHAPCGEIGALLAYARARLDRSNRDSLRIPVGLTTRACVRARGLGVVHNSRIGTFADAGSGVFLVGHVWLLFGFLFNSRSHPATGK